MSSYTPQKVVTAPGLRNQKGLQKIAMLTAYDYAMAYYLDETGVDVILVGDSLGTVIYGEPNTLSVTLEDMIRHTRAVSKACKRSLVLADMPFLTYQLSPESAVANAGRLIKEAGAQAIKLEGGVEFASTVQKLVLAGIPVCGHIGLTPQSIHALGGYRMHGKKEEERRYLLESAIALETSGAFMLVLECVEPTLAAEITQRLTIPTIGIGSGLECDGQVLVIHDLVGMTVGRVPRFVHPLADLKEPFKEAVRGYIHRTLNPNEPYQPKPEPSIQPGLKTDPHYVRKTDALQES